MSARPWSFARRFLFWFALAYFALYTFPFPLTSLPTWGIWESRLDEPELPPAVADSLENWDRGLAWLSERTRSGWDAAVVWTADRFDSVEITARPMGSGDTTLNYVQDGLRMAAGIALGLLACLVFRERTPPRFLRWCLTVGARYYVAFTLLSYGFAKVIKSQFPHPHLERLLQPYGESSPMGLVWTFMGTSGPYNWFTGGGEILGGLLLLFRRTTTLGALVTIGVMANVAMLNYAYDIPVKLFSTNLLLFATALALADARRLWSFFLRNDPVEPRDLSPPFASRVLRGLAQGLKLLILVHVVWAHVEGAQNYRELRDGRERPELYGIWDVRRFVVDGVELPPLTTSSERWAHLVIDLPGWNGTQNASLHDMTGERRSFTLSVGERVPDPAAGPNVPPADTLILGPISGDGARVVLEYVRPSETELVLRGRFEEAELEVELTRRLPEDFLLMNRGFHWINEVPFNR